MRSDHEQERHRVGLIREPRGRVIAKVYDEGSIRVAERRVTEAHIYRVLDAWPLGEHALEQTRDLNVDLLRYVAPGGTYEIPFAIFVKLADRIGFPHETQYVLARRSWRFKEHEQGTGTGAATTGAPKAVHNASDIRKTSSPAQMSLPLFPDISATG